MAALEHLRDAVAVGEACDTQPFMVGHLVAQDLECRAVLGLEPQCHRDFGFTRAARDR